MSTGPAHNGPADNGPADNGPAENGPKDNGPNDTASAAAQFWDGRYRDYHGTWGERANPLLAQVAGPLPPGRALDLGCGTGGDTLWLARRGWQVIGVDISATAVDQVRRRAVELGLGDRVATAQHDLTSSFPGGQFDLVCAQYLHTPFTFDRSEFLRAAATPCVPVAYCSSSSTVPSPRGLGTKTRTRTSPPPPRSWPGWTSTRADGRRCVPTGPDGRPPVPAAKRRWSPIMCCWCAESPADRGRPLP